VARLRDRFPLAAIEANLTPMIDISFLLVVFFVLVTRISDSERAEMALAKVPAGPAARAEEEARSVLNVLPGADGRAAGYRLNGVDHAPTPEGLAALAEALAEGYRRNPRLAVQLRADRSTRYEWVEPAMRATTAAARLAGGDALPRLRFVVEEETRDGA
jgi:biopolymer transport protein ExbD